MKKIFISFLLLLLTLGYVQAAISLFQSEETITYIKYAFNPVFYVIFALVLLVLIHRYISKKDSKKSNVNMKYITGGVIAFTLILYLVDYNLILDKEVASHYDHGYNNTIVGKPVIYLYPEETTNIYINLEFDGELIADYPAYDDNISGWNVISTPESEVTDVRDGKKYSYIFWEGVPEVPVDWDLSTGFVVAGEDVRNFFQDILPSMGLTSREYNEFVVYWYPILQVNPYNLIHFATDQYTDIAPLNTVPEYDSLLRVFMVAKPLDEPIDIQSQVFEDFERTGFSVVEWGGAVIGNQSFQ